VALLLAAGGDTRLLKEAGCIIAVGAAALALAEPLGRILIGPAAMDIAPERAKLYWRGSTAIGIVLLLWGVMQLRS
jgi:hypothetical protein